MTIEGAPGRARTALIAIAVAVTAASCGSAPKGATQTPGATPSEAASATPTPGSTATPAPQATANHGAPSARTLFAAGYDPVTHSLIIEGGVTTAGGAPVGQTWAWDGAQWHRLADGPAVERASLTPDPISGHLLLIGGSDGRYSSAQTGMWSWTGTGWTRVADNPAQGAISQATTDPMHKQVLVNATGPTGVCIPSQGCATPAPYEQYGHYVWNGLTWKAAPTDFADYYGSTGAADGFDPISSRVIQQGDVAQSDGDATLGWDGTAWKILRMGSLDPSTAEAFRGTAATDGHVLVMLGDPKTSNAGIASTWSFDGNNWQRHMVNEPAGGSYLVYDAAVSAFVAVGGALGTADGLDVWVLQNLADGWKILPH